MNAVVSNAAHFRLPGMLAKHLSCCWACKRRRIIRGRRGLLHANSFARQKGVYSDEEVNDRAVLAVDNAIDFILSNGFAARTNVSLLKKLLQLLPVVLLRSKGGSIVEGMHLNVFLIVPRENLGNQKSIGEIPANMAPSVRGQRELLRQNLSYLLTDFTEYAKSRLWIHFNISRGRLTGLAMVYV